MRRIEIVLGELERLTRGLCLADLAQETAFTAEAIGFNLGLARNSVSKDLNQLWNDGLAIKSRGSGLFSASPGAGNVAGTTAGRV